MSAVLINFYYIEAWGFVGSHYRDQGNLISIKRTVGSVSLYLCCNLAGVYNLGDSSLIFR